MDARKKVVDNMNSNLQREILLKLKMTLGIKAISGILYVEALIKKIELVKQILIYDVEQGNESFIPKELSQDNLPLSFRFYDPIIPII